jgi:hypothetical protein
MPADGLPAGFVDASQHLRIDQRFLGEEKLEI